MEHYWKNNDNLKSELRSTTAVIRDKEYTFYTDNGVFSKKGLDFGTRTLLENLPLEEMKGNILDFGCGYGPIGIVLAKETDNQVDMVDINRRSLSLAEKNAIANQVTVHIFESDRYQNISKRYRYIITNPPIRVGKTILYEILENAKNRLDSKGELWFVIHKDQGALTVSKHLEAFYQIEIVAKNKGFYVIRAICG